jgi:hypothetical protein
MRLSTIANFLGMMAAINLLIFSILDILFGNFVIAIIELALGWLVFHYEFNKYGKARKPRVIHRNYAFRGAFYIALGILAFFGTLLFIAGILLILAGIFYIAAQIRGEREAEQFVTKVRSPAEIVVVDAQPGYTSGYYSGQPRYAAHNAPAAGGMYTNPPTQPSGQGVYAAAPVQPQGPYAV